MLFHAAAVQKLLNRRSSDDQAALLARMDFTITHSEDFIQLPPDSRTKNWHILDSNMAKDTIANPVIAGIAILAENLDFHQVMMLNQPLATNQATSYSGQFSDDVYAPNPSMSKNRTLRD